MPIRLTLRSLLLTDAATCAAMGSLLAFGAGEVARLTQLPPALALYAGLSLFPVAAFMVLVATRPRVPVAGARVVVVGNVLWVAASLLLLLTGLVAPNALGVTFVVAQALAVALLAKLELDALRNTPAHGGAVEQPAR